VSKYPRPGTPQASAPPQLPRLLGVLLACAMLVLGLPFFLNHQAWWPSLMCDMVTIVGGSLVAWYRSSSDVGERVWWGGVVAFKKEIQAEQIRGRLSRVDDPQELQCAS